MPIRFTQDFRSDLEQIYFRGKPYAFIRFGDGERAFCDRRPIVTCGEWKYDGSDSEIAKGVDRAIAANLPGLFIGISCPCCDKKAHQWYLKHVNVPRRRLTYANLFVNANWVRFMQKFKALDRSEYVLVSCRKGDIRVPKNAIENPYDHDALLRELFKVRKTILIAAGPLKCRLIHDYWTRAPRKQIVLDIGSVLDMKIHGHPTRGYHIKTRPTRKRVCIWS